VLVGWVLGCPLGDAHSFDVIRLVGVFRAVAFLPLSNKNKRKWKNIAWINI
jgi:hypothetical protein